MTAVLLLAACALLCAFAAAAQLLGGRPAGESTPDEAGNLLPWAPSGTRTGSALSKLDLGSRLTRAGLEDRISIPALLAAKLGGAVAGGLWGLVVSPGAPARLAWIVAIGMPVAGFSAPDAWLEFRARRRLRSLRAGLPDALDLLAVGTAAGRNPIAGLAELGVGDGPVDGSRRLFFANARRREKQAHAIGVASGQGHAYLLPP